MKKLILLLLLLAIPTKTYAQASDICKNTLNLQSVAINIAAATTTKLVDNGVSNRRAIVPCNLSLSVVGAASPQVITFISGTGATCGTGTTIITGPFIGPAATTTVELWSMLLMWMGRIKNGDSLCMTTGTVSQIGGVMTWVFVGPA